jgi:hypothetical protein
VTGVGSEDVGLEGPAFEDVRIEAVGFEGTFAFEVEVEGRSGGKDAVTVDPVAAAAFAVEVEGDFFGWRTCLGTRRGGSRGGESRRGESGRGESRRGESLIL